MTNGKKHVNYCITHVSCRSFSCYGVTCYSRWWRNRFSVEDESGIVFTLKKEFKVPKVFSKSTATLTPPTCIPSLYWGVIFKLTSWFKQSSLRLNLSELKTDCAASTCGWFFGNSCCSWHWTDPTIEANEQIHELPKCEHACITWASRWCWL